MKIIRNTELFNDLVINPSWKNLFTAAEDVPELKDYSIPVLKGGLDHIKIQKKGIYFLDRGCNGLDNSFVVRPELL